MSGSTRSLIPFLLVSAALCTLPGCIAWEIRDELQVTNQKLGDIEGEINQTQEQLSSLSGQLEKLDSIDSSLTSIDESLKKLDEHLASLRRTLKNIDNTIPFLSISDDDEEEEDEEEEVDGEVEGEGGKTETDESSSAAEEALDFDGAPVIDELIEVSDSILPVNVGVNQLPAGMMLVDRHLLAGRGLFPKGLGRPSPNLKVQGIFSEPGVEVVKVDVSRNQPADLFRARDRAAPDAEVSLIDADGTAYRPTGYIHERSDGTEIMLSPDRPIESIAELPDASQGEDQRLRLIFHVTEGAELRGLQVGDVAVGQCSVVVRDDG